MRIKILVLAIALIILCPVAFAKENDMSALTFNEIQNELDTFNLKIWQTGNWSSIIVPDGSYIVGKNIPAGQFSLRSATSKMSSLFTLIPSGSDDDNYSQDQRYLDLSLSSSDDVKVDLIDGDRIVIEWAGTKFINPDYMPRFNVDSVQDEAVSDLRNEYNQLLSELKSRPEWCEVAVPEGTYEIGEKIPVSHWTIWPKGTRAGVHYGKGDNNDGSYFGSEINAALKDTSLSSFVFGYHEGWVSIDMQEGWHIRLENDVIFTPYIGTTPFMFNE